MAINNHVQTKSNKWMAIFFSLSLLILSGCGTMRNYDRELSTTMDLAANGRPEDALMQLEKNNTSENKDLLYYEEKGQLLNILGRFEESKASWFSADEMIKLWEADVKSDPDKVIGDIASVVVNDKSRTYEGQDFEKVMLSTKLALNHIQLGDFDAARIEIKKTHEREAIIAEFRAKEVEKLEEKKKENNIKTEVKDLKGYPVETLNDPEVTALKNSYQSAFSHYLAGFVYEALGETSLAAPGYRKAIELRPDVRWLEQGLASLETRGRGINRNESDVLFVVETGSIPARQSVRFPVPVPTPRGIRTEPFSVPVLRPDRNTFLPNQINVDNQQGIDVYNTTNLSAMAFRALKDDMPGIIIRGTIRAITKVATDEALKNTHPLLQIGAKVGQVITEDADERAWRTLPANILLGRATLKAGKHTITINTPYGPRTASVEIAGKHAIIPIRLLGDTLFLNQPKISSKMITASELTSPTPSPQENRPSQTKKSKKKQ